MRSGPQFLVSSNESDAHPATSSRARIAKLRFMSDSTKSLPDYIEIPTSDRHQRLAVPPDCAGMRFDQALARLMPEYSRNRLQEWMRSGHITLDGTAVSAKTKVWGGETVIV